MTPEDITRLDELHAKTTPGEWSADIGSSPLGQTGDFEPYADIKCHGEYVAYFNEMAGVALRTGIDVQEGNSLFTAAAHNAWPAISAELKETERLRQRYIAEYNERCKFETALNATEELASELRRELTRLRDDNLRLRKTLAHVPGNVAIKAKEDAGFGMAIVPTDVRREPELTRLREFETHARALLAAVKNSEFSGFSFEDINGVNWFDARANLDRKRGEHNES